MDEEAVIFEDGVNHSCCMVPVVFHLASVRRRWLLVESDRTVMSRMQRRERLLIIIPVITTGIDQ